MSTATATQTVHVVLPHFTNHALYEGKVDWRACSAVAVEVAIAGVEGRIPDAGNAQKTWARMMATGHVTRNATTHAVTGATLADCKWALADRGYTAVDFIDYSDTPNLAALHSLLKSATLAGHAVIGIYTNGQALPDNERGVKGHFVTAGGIDSLAGYLLANGDTQEAIAHQATYMQFPQCGEVPTHWATWATLVAAGLHGIIAVHPRIAPKAAAPVTAAPVATPQSAQESAQALAAVQAAITALQSLESALKAS